MTDKAQARGTLLGRALREQRMQLRHLRAILAIADYGSITRAAEKLHVTQAAVSKVVAEIEEILETSMLERRGREVSLTPAGTFVVNAAKRIVAEVRVLAEDIDLLSEGASGLVTIGVQAVSAQFLLALAVVDFKAQWPRAAVHIREGLLPNLLGELRAGRLDFVIGRMEPETMTPDLDGLSLSVDPVIVVASPGHRILQLISCGWADVVHECWRLPLPGTPMRDHFDHMPHVLGLGSPSNIIESNSPTFISLLLRKMSALALSPLSRANYCAETGIAMPTRLTIPSLSTPIGFIWSKKLALGPTARTFRQSLLRRRERESSQETVASWMGPLSATRLRTNKRATFTSARPNRKHRRQI